MIFTSLVLAAALTSTPTLAVQHAPVGGHDIAYASVGADDAPPLLLLNGTASPMADWDPKLLSRLADDGHRVIVFDYVGLGQSSAIAEGTSFADLADDAAGLIHALGYEAMDVVGWSMGGFIAQELLTKHPETVNKAVLAATNPGGDRAVLGPKWVQRIDSNADSSLSAYVKTNYPDGYRDRGWAFINRVNGAIKAGRYPKYRVPSRTDRIMVEAEDPWLRSNVNLDALRAVTAPVLVIDGRDDVVTPLRNSKVLTRALVGSRLEVVPRSGHSFLFQMPVKAADRIDEFLSE